jgi:hypothetical protein
MIAAPCRLIARAVFRPLLQQALAGRTAQLLHRYSDMDGGDTYCFYGSGHGSAKPIGLLLGQDDPSNSGALVRGATIALRLPRRSISR